MYRGTSHESTHSKEGEAVPSGKGKVPQLIYEHRSPILPTEEFCSPMCMMTLKRGFGIDKNCPNFRLHCRAAFQNEISQHPVGAATVVEELRSLLVPDAIWHIMEPIIYRRGRTAQLFRVVHPKYGYAFAAKGVNGSDAGIVEEESRLYEHMWLTRGLLKNSQSDGFPLITTLSAPSSESETLSHSSAPDVMDSSLTTSTSTNDTIGIGVPVSFGVIKPKPEHSLLIYPFWPFQDNLAYAMSCNTFLLLSYHGESFAHPSSLGEAWCRLTSIVPSPLARLQPAKPHKDHASQLAEVNKNIFSTDNVQQREQNSTWWLQRQCFLALKSIGIVHDDLAPRNMLWSEQLKSVFVVDFESSYVLPAPVSIPMTCEIVE